MLVRYPAFGLRISDPLTSAALDETGAAKAGLLDLGLQNLAPPWE